MKNMTESRSEIVFVPFEEVYAPGFEDIPRRLPDISKLRQLIGYRPTSNLREMLEQTIAYHRTCLEIGVANQ